MRRNDICPTPWTLAPLEGKYYGTTILDNDGNKVATIWRGKTWFDDKGSLPSPRELANDPDFEPCDNHYETALTFNTATAIIEAANARFPQGT